ncbi:hypothetical protein CDAR_535351 [Caerostris darwini]|uniref:Uncharacterized protein n=1 Tax=Caerostris darwini TaxID=1538125 RepID=A0AAV4VLA8_9ARAC|nr:hypothetical protein CDAR_535351 [Caerostris darwini]
MFQKQTGPCKTLSGTIRLVEVPLFKKSIILHYLGTTGKSMAKIEAMAMGFFFLNNYFNEVVQKQNSMMLPDMEKISPEWPPSVMNAYHSSQQSRTEAVPLVVDSVVAEFILCLRHVIVLSSEHLEKKMSCGSS